MARDLDGRTVLNQDVETLLDEQVGIENDKAEREGQDIVAGANFEEIANRILEEEEMTVSYWDCIRTGKIAMIVLGGDRGAQATPRTRP